jgi:hypothetical protein
VSQRRIGGAAIAVLAATMMLIQFLPSGLRNPPVTGDLNAPDAVAATLRRACYDCHSNETRWPWYSRIAPVSWLIARDLAHGRRELNFSEWSSYFPATRRRKLQWMERSIEDGKMPPASYLLMHPAARLDAEDKSALTNWIASALAEPVTH